MTPSVPYQCTLCFCFSFGLVLGTHELLSISFIGSESKAEFIPVEGTTEEALDLMMIKMNEISIFNCCIQSILNSFGMIANLEDERVRKRLRAQLLDWLDQ